MDVISSLASNPLPTAIAAIVAIAACLGYYFFVIPLMDEHKKLKEKYETLVEEHEEGHAGKFTEQLGEIQEAVHRLRDALTDGSQNDANKLKMLEDFFSEISKYHITVDRGHEDLQGELEKLNSLIRKVSEFSQTFVAGAKARDDSIDRLLVEVNRNMNSINEKQSQILGALLGMSRIQDRNRGI